MEKIFYLILSQSSCRHISVAKNFTYKDKKILSNHQLYLCCTILYFQKSMEKVGCTSPFGFNLNKICTDQILGKEATKMYEDFFRQNKNTKECLYPCSFLNIILTPQELRHNNINRTSFFFEEYIKVSTSYFAYTELELLAELGGYVGLFMGLSVFDLRHAFNRIFFH